MTSWFCCIFTFLLQDTGGHFFTSHTEKFSGQDLDIVLPSRMSSWNNKHLSLILELKKKKKKQQIQFKDELQEQFNLVKHT